MIKIYNKNNEEYNGDNVYYIGRPSVLGNPYSYLPEDKCLAIYKCKNREESITKYSQYFDIMYGSNLEYTKIIDEIYEKYKSGEDVYLGCWCVPKPCHGEIIKKKLEQRLLREKMQKYVLKNERVI